MIRRRLFAFFVLFACAIGSALFWNDGTVNLIDMGANLLAAGAGMVFLHYRWRAQENRALSPGQVRDIFS